MFLELGQKGFPVQQNVCLENQVISFFATPFFVVFHLAQTVHACFWVRTNYPMRLILFVVETHETYFVENLK